MFNYLLLGIAWMSTPIMGGLSTALAQEIISPKLQTVNAAIGQPVGTRFAFKNANSEPLVIAKVSVSAPQCRAVFTRSPVATNYHAVVSIRCEVSNEGYYSRSARIYFSNGKTTVVSMKGKIKPSTDSSCADIRLDKNGGSMEQIVARFPVVSQSGGTCSFHTAVQLYDSWRMRNFERDSFYLSAPTALAYEIKLSKKAKNFTGGKVKSNLEQLLSVGSCRRDYFTRENGKDFDEVFYDRLFQKFRTTDDLVELKNFAYQLLGIRQFFEVNATSNDTVLKKAMKDQNYIAFVRELVPPTCSADKRQTASLPFQIRSEDSTREIFGHKWHSSERVKREIHAEFDQGISEALPVAISYCSTVLKEGRDFNEIRSAADFNCGNHASLVIGRRKNKTTGSCQLLLRNTWYEGYSYNTDWESEEGTSHVWVDEKTLTNAIFHTDRISEFSQK